MGGLTDGFTRWHQDQRESLGAYASRDSAEVKKPGRASAGVFTPSALHRSSAPGEQPTPDAWAVSSSSVPVALRDDGGASGQRPVSYFDVSHGQMEPDVLEAVEGTLPKDYLAVSQIEVPELMQSV